MKSFFRTALLLLALAAAAPVLSADAIRGSVVDILQVRPNEQAGGSCRLEELLAVDLPEGATFFKGIEVEITIPQELMRFRNSFAVYIYKAASPDPVKDQIRRYTAASTGYYIIPNTRKMYIQIPLRENTDLPRSPETILVKTLDENSDFPLLLTILPIMKGIPTDISRAVFAFKAYPYMADEGILQLNLETPGNEPYSVVVDNSPLPYRNGGYRLSAGAHEVEIRSEAYLPLTRTVSISAGKTTKLDIALEKKEPTLNFEVPDGTVIFLDGNQVSGASLKTTEGLHTVVFKLGDYSMTREFEVSGGKRYTVTLFFDVFVKEN